MNICHAYLFFSIKFAGGTCDLMYKICKAQEKQGHTPIVYSGDFQFDQSLANKLKKTRFIILKSWFDKMGFSIMPGLRKQLEVDRNEIDIFHLHVFRTFQNLWIYRFCKKHKIPFVIDAHGAVPRYRRKRFLKLAFDYIWGKKMLNDAEYLIAETNVGVNEYLEIDPTIDKEKIVVISPPFDTDEYKVIPRKGNFRRRFGISSDKTIVMFLGRVNHIKGIDFLIQGFEKLTHLRKDCILVIVGSDDGHLEECKALANVLKISDKVIFTGFLGGEDKNEALVDADIVAQTSRHEQGAWAPFEAILCGTPIVVTSHTGAGEDVKRIDAGETVNFGNKEGLCQKLNYMIENYDKMKVKANKAGEYIRQNMSMNARAKEYIEVYQMASKKRLDK